MRTKAAVMAQGALVAMAVLAAGPAAAAPADHPAVVELFTSQGCSSCPPADALLAQIATRQDVIALALHVDYWDYIGWADTFGDPAYTTRQRSYARAMGENMVYTPQMIINGSSAIVGSDAEALVSALTADDEDAPVLRLSRSGGTLSIRADAAPDLSAPVRVMLVRYHPKAEVAIQRGENSGRTITYTNIVTSLTEIGQWDGSRALQMDVGATGKQMSVVLLQEAGPGRIVAAAETQ
jgi:hypothetical protein